LEQNGDIHVPLGQGRTERVFFNNALYGFRDKRLQVAQNAVRGVIFDGYFPVTLGISDGIGGQGCQVFKE